MTDEWVLVERCLGGEQAGFEALFQCYRVPAWRLAYAITGDRGLADDAAQEAFIQAFRSLRNLRRGSPFGPWFYAIVANRARRLAVRPPVVALGAPGRGGTTAGPAGGG